MSRPLTHPKRDVSFVDGPIDQLDHGANQALWGGKVCIDGKSQHTSHRIYLIHVKADHSVDIPKVWDDIQPYWLGQVGCDLTKKPDANQYTPSNLPKK